MVIDSNIFIDYLRAKEKQTTRFYQILNGENKIFISAVSVFELYSGATSREKEKRVKILIEDIPVLTFNYEVALKAAEIWHQLKSKNQLIEFRDIFIAATCIIQKLPIVTFNRKHFERIDGLEII